MGSAIDLAVATSNQHPEHLPPLTPPRALFFATEHTKCQHVERRETGIGKEGVWRGLQSAVSNRDWRDRRAVLRDGDCVGEEECLI